MTCHSVLPFSVMLWRDEVTIQVLQRQRESSKRQRLGHQMMHGKTIWKLGTSEIAKASRGIPHWTQQEKFTALHMDTQLQGANVLMHAGIWPMTIEPNPSWKTEVTKSAWIKPYKVNKRSIILDPTTMGYNICDDLNSCGFVISQRGVSDPGLSGGVLLVFRVG